MRLGFNLVNKINTNYNTFMSLKIDIFHNFKHLDKHFNELATSDLISATRASMNNASRRTRAQGANFLRNRILLKKREFRKRIQIEKARGGSLSSLNTSLVFSGLPISMLAFVVGSKQPIDQKGKKVKKRRKLKARIKPGKTIRLKGAFIQDITSKQVFRHIGSGRRARKISTKSLAKILVEQRIQSGLEDMWNTRFDRQFEKQIRWRWDKTTAKANRVAMYKAR